MNISKTLAYIYDKINIFDFDFDYDFIESLKITPGLYEILELLLLKKNRIKNINYEIIDNIDNQYIKIIYELLTCKLDIYNFNDSKESCLLLYDKLDYHIKNTDDEIIKSLLCKIQIEYYNNSIKYFDEKIRPLLNFEDNIIIAKFKLLVKSIDKKDSTDFKILSREILNFKDCNKSIKQKIYIFKLIYKFKNSITIENANNIINNIKLLYGDLLHPLLQKIYKLNIFLIKYDLLKIQYSQKNNIYLFDFNYIPLYKESYEYCKHIYNCNLLIHNKDKYLEYINNLYDNKSSMLSGVFVDLLSCNNNNKNFSFVSNIYYIMKDYIMYIIKLSNSPQIKINISFVILQALYNDNKLYSIKDLNNIISNLDISNEIYQKYDGNRLNMLKNKIMILEKYIIDKGYILNYKNNIDDICLICCEEIKEDIITTIQCKKCKKELGHFCCVIKWFMANVKNKCPQCRQ